MGEIRSVPFEEVAHALEVAEAVSDSRTEVVEVAEAKRGELVNVVAKAGDVNSLAQELVNYAGSLKESAAGKASSRLSEEQVGGSRRYRISGAFPMLSVRRDFQNFC